MDEGPMYFGNELEYPSWEPDFGNMNALILGNFTNATHNFDEPLKYIGSRRKRAEQKRNLSVMRHS